MKSVMSVRINIIKKVYENNVINRKNAHIFRYIRFSYVELTGVEFTDGGMRHVASHEQGSRHD